MDCII